MPTPAGENGLFNSLVLLKSSCAGPGGVAGQDGTCLLRCSKADAQAPAEQYFQLPKCARLERD